MNQQFVPGLRPLSELAMMNNNYMPQRYSSPVNRAYPPTPPTNLPRPYLEAFSPGSVANQRQNFCVNGPDHIGTNPSAALCDHQGAIPSQLPANVSNVLSPSRAAPTPLNSITVSSMTGFTFTTPTQSSLYSPALTATPQTQGFLYSGTGGRMFAPTGCSATWQHAVPHRMPWQTSIPSIVSNTQGISVFTGKYFYCL